jgi:cation transport ATPase
LWAAISEPTAGLVAFTAADHVAGLPTIRKAWLAPEGEHHMAFTMGVVNGTIAVMTVSQFTTANVLFPGTIAIFDAIVSLLIVTKIGPRWAARYRPH